MTRIGCAAISISLVIGGCSRSESTRADSAAVSSVPANPTPPSNARPMSANTMAACPHTGRWALCNVETRLRQSGFVARRLEGDSPRRPGFSVSPAVYSLGASRLEVFIYSDEAALARDMAKLDTIRVVPVGAVSPWEGNPLLVRSGNLAAVFLTQSPQKAERLSLALTAGAPQPGSPR